MPVAATSSSNDGALERALLEFSALLGPASDRLLRKPEVLPGIVAEVRAGRSVTDAVLACVHRHLPGHRQLVDEFAAYFLMELLRTGGSSMNTASKLRRFLDTGDLVLSVFGDLGGDFSDLQFDSASQFRALFAKRMNWKAADQARRLTSKRRREDQRVPGQPEDLDYATEDSAQSPPSQAIRSEENDQLILTLLRMESRDRELLTLRLKGLSVEEIARTVGLSTDAARKAIDRAIAKARRLVSGPPRDRKPEDST